MPNYLDVELLTNFVFEARARCFVLLCFHVVAEVWWEKRAGTELH